MPQLVEYVNKENLQPTDRGTEARVQEGRRIGAAYNQVAEGLRDFANRTGQNIGSAVRDAGNAAVDYVDHQQISQGAASGAMLFNTLTNGLNDTVKSIDTNDPGYASAVGAALDKWRTDKLEPALEKFRDGFTTEKSQNWAEHFIDQTRQHFFVHSAAETSTAAGIGVQNNAKQVLTTGSNTVVSDPSALKTQLDLWDHTINGVVGSSRLSGTDALKATTTIKEEGRRKLTNDAAAAAIQKSKDPEATAQEWIKTWPQYIDGDTALKLGKAAKVQAKANDLTDKQAAAFKRQQDEDAVRTGSADIVGKSVTVDPATGKVTIAPEYFKSSLDLVRKYPDAPNAASVAQALINWGEHQQQQRREQTVSDPSTKTDLYTRMFSADNPTTDVDIYKAETQDQLSRFDAQNLLNLRKAVEDKPLTGPMWHNVIESVKGSLGTDPIGHEKFGQFVSAFIPQYQAAARAGTLPPNALDLRDPKSMISQALSQFRRDPAQMFMDRVSHGMIAPGELNTPGAAGLVDKATGVNPMTVRQGGHTYKRQSDGSWKAID